MTSSPQAVSLRLPKPLHAAVTDLAKRRKVSVNKLIEQELARAIEAEERARLQDEFRAIAAAGEDIELGFELGSEVVMRDAA